MSEAGDPLAARAPVRWATEELRGALEDRGVTVEVLELPNDQPAGPTVFVAGSGAARATQQLARAAVSIASVPEALGLVPVSGGADPALLATGADERGLVYAVLEMADRVAHAMDPLGALRIERPIVEQPANTLRSVARLFTSELNDKPWFHDEGFWRRYLSMLAAQRFNRFNLMVGLGYNFPWRISDAYLYFAYPFLVDVPGYDVRVPQLPDDERERNLATLRFVSEETVARGLDFQFGLWTHAYGWVDSPDALHTIEGLTPDNHATYCRDALQLMLDACPAIGGLTIRTHGESGIPERTWDFWRVVLDGVPRSGRRVGIDLHAKGLDEETLGIARETGMPVTVSPKYWAEHMGLPYHQAAIRESELPPTEEDRDPKTGKARFMVVSEGSRSHTRYGYGDFLREDRDYDVVFRIWPGTQRLLLWGDPAMAAGFGRLASLAGSQGLEWCEPLSLKGREGTGLPGPRDGYADASLSSPDDWQKYAYTYRLLGRLTYNPDADPDTWRRYLRSRFGGSARSAESALASASRILPLVTTAHHPSASNNYYWPEIYTDFAIVDGDAATETHYYDTPVPKRFGTASPLDPEVFSSVEGSVHELLGAARSGRYSVVDVAGWLERLSDDALKGLASMEDELADPSSEARRLIVDVAIQSAIGRFFAGKLRAAFLYELAIATGSQVPLPDALAAHRAARAAWADAVERAAGVYVEDLTFGPQPFLRGTWADRLPAIDQDVAEMAELVRTPWHQPDIPAREVRRVLAEAARQPPSVEVSHRPPASFRRGKAITVSLDVDPADAGSVAGARLRYRRMDQSVPYAEVEMLRVGDAFVATAPGDDADPPYPLQYFFVLLDDRGMARLYPGLDRDLSNQPYYVVRDDGR